MSTTTHCDLCQATNDKDQPWITTRISGTDLRVFGFPEYSAHYDLCPECGKKFLDFVKPFFNK